MNALAQVDATTTQRSATCRKQLAAFPKFRVGFSQRCLLSHAYNLRKTTGPNGSEFFEGTFASIAMRNWETKRKLIALGVL